jgi:Fe-S cluster assembly protein SufD
MEKNQIIKKQELARETALGTPSTAPDNKLNIIRIEKPADNSNLVLKENSSNYIFVSNDTSREIYLDCRENSKSKYIELNNSKNPIEVKRKLNLAKGASVEFFSIYTGDADSNTSTHAILSDESSIILRNIIISDSQQQNHDIIVIHNGENSKSNLQSRGVLSNSRITLKGLIQINENAQDSEGYQKSDLLILNNSQAISIPDLQIHNNKVKCSHGSSITRLDAEKVFYLQSRGYSEDDAKSALLNGHLSSIISEINANENNKAADKLNDINDKNSDEINEIISKKLFKIIQTVKS